MNVFPDSDGDSLKLPQEIERHVASLAQLYKHKREDLLQQLLVNAEIALEQHSYDNWDGGQYGFLLRLRVPDTIFAQIVEDKDTFRILDATPGVRGGTPYFIYDFLHR